MCAQSVARNCAATVGCQFAEAAGRACDRQRPQGSQQLWPMTIGWASHWNYCMQRKSVGSKPQPPVPSGHLSFATWRLTKAMWWRKPSTGQSSGSYSTHPRYDGLLWDEITYLESYTLGLFDILFSNHQREYNQDVVRQNRNIVVYGGY
jgi:hypothetical protein